MKSALLLRPLMKSLTLIRSLTPLSDSNRCWVALLVWRHWPYRLLIATFYHQTTQGTSRPQGGNFRPQKNHPEGIKNATKQNQSHGPGRHTSRFPPYCYWRIIGHGRTIGETERRSTDPANNRRGRKTRQISRDRLTAKHEKGSSTKLMKLQEAENADVVFHNGEG